MISLKYTIGQKYAVLNEPFKLREGVAVIFLASSHLTILLLMHKESIILTIRNYSSDGIRTVYSASTLYNGLAMEMLLLYQKIMQVF